VNTGREVSQGRCFFSSLFILYSGYVNKRGLEGFVDVRVGGQIILTVKCAAECVLPTKEGTVPEGVIDRLIEIGRCFGVEMNIEETKVMRISRQRSLLQSMIAQEQLENVQFFSHVGSLLTDDVRHTREIISGLPWRKQH
jgi:hypothetical protein